MSLLERRLQVLLDAERFARLEEESRGSGRSVGAIVREAIDRHFDARQVVELRSAAARRLLAETAIPADAAAGHAEPGEPDWSASKAAIVADLDRVGD